MHQVKEKGILDVSHNKQERPSSHDNDNRIRRENANAADDNRRYIGKKTGFIQRQRKVTGAGFAQALVLGGMAHPQSTRKQVHHSAIQAGMEVSVQGLDQRFTVSGVNFMRTLFETALSEVMVSEQVRDVLPQFAGVYVTDCTRLEWMRGGEKLAVRLELQGGKLEASLNDLHCHDQKTGIIDLPLPVGALHLGDLGFFKLKRFEGWNADGVYWLTRYKVGTTLTTLEGEVVDFTTLLAGQSEVVLPVRVGSQQTLTAYLVAAPLTDAAALAKREAHLQDTARRRQRPLSARQVELAGWTVYLTNIPDLTFTQAHTLARTRWQIELLFKLWKSHGHVLASRSADPLRQQCEGYAKLLGMVMAHWMVLVSGWHPPTLGALDALRMLRTYVPLLLRSFTDTTLWRLAFTWLQHDLALAPPLSRRGKVPLAFQLWQACDLVLP